MRAAPVLVLLALLPLAAADPPDHVRTDDPAHDLTLAGWRGAPLVLGTDCPRTDLLHAEVAPHADGTLVVIATRDLQQACDGENGPLQGFSYTLNVLTTDGGEGWAEVELLRWGDRLDVDLRWSARCDGRVPLPTTSCEHTFGGRAPATFDPAASTLKFVAPFPWDEVRAVWFASVMWDCGSSEGGHVCVTGSFVGPGDRMPDVGEQATR